MTSASALPRIRPFTPEDYPGVVAVVNAAAPEYPFTPEEYARRDARFGPEMKRARWVAVEAGGRIVGAGEYSQRSDMYHPRKFSVGVHVHPEYQGRGVGGALYETVEAALLPHDPLALRAFGHETRPASVRFAGRRGFTELMRDAEARLDLTAFDFGRYVDAESAVAAQGIAFRSYAELAADPDRDRKLCDLTNAVMQDVPPRGERTPVDLDTFRRDSLDGRRLIPEGCFVAVAPGGEYVGVCEMVHAPGGDPAVIGTGLTGVRREWRRQGIAVALKVRGLRFAREQGKSEMRTFNASDNDPVLSLNARLGFVRQPARIHLMKTFTRA